MPDIVLSYREIIKHERIKKSRNVFGLMESLREQ